MPNFLRSPRIASRVFGLDTPGQLVRRVPRMKFMFYAQFVLSASARLMIGNPNATLDGYQDPRAISFKVRQIDKPKVTLTTADLNQYNKKKVVYTKLEYSEASMRLFDAVDDSVLAIWVDYFTYYFGDSRIKTTQEYKQSPVNASLLDGTGWGFRPLDEETQFFDRITVYGFYANTYTRFSYINPRITSIDWQNREYASEDPEEVLVNFKYEAIEYERFAQPYQAIDSIFGWNRSDARNLPEPEGPQYKASQPRIFNEPSSQSQVQPAPVAPNDGPADDIVLEIDKDEWYNRRTNAAFPTMVYNESDIAERDTRNDELRARGRRLSERIWGGDRPSLRQVSSSDPQQGASQISAYGPTSGATPPPLTPAQEQAINAERAVQGRQAAVRAGFISPTDTTTQVVPTIDAGIVTSVNIGGQNQAVPLTQTEQSTLRRASGLFGRSSDF